MCACVRPLLKNGIDESAKLRFGPDPRDPCDPRDPREPRSGEPGSNTELYAVGQRCGEERFLSGSEILVFLGVEMCRWVDEIVRNWLGNES